MAQASDGLNARDGWPGLASRANGLPPTRSPLQTGWPCASPSFYSFPESLARKECFRLVSYLFIELVMQFVRHDRFHEVAIDAARLRLRATALVGKTGNRDDFGVFEF